MSSADFILNNLLLLGLGLSGWLIFSLIRFPASHITGPILLIGTLRVLQLDIPFSPPFLLILFQVMLGWFVGSMINRETVRKLKEILLPASIIVIWAIFMAFAVGILISRLSSLDLYTAILSSAMGGLPEMTVLALTTGAHVPIIILMQMLRLTISVIVFPLIFRRWMKNEDNMHGVRKGNIPGEPGLHHNENRDNIFASLQEIPRNVVHGLSSIKSFLLDNKTDKCLLIIKFFFALGLSYLGGSLFSYFGVPAGIMVGAMVFNAGASLSGFRLIAPSPKLLKGIILGVGIIVADNISIATLRPLFDLSIAIPLLISLVVTFLSSIAVAHLINRKVGWDFPTSFLAAAPSGFTIITAVAIKYDKNPFHISLLHLSRLVAIKTIVPLVFTFMII